MIPIRITLSGFMSYKEPQTLDFAGDSLWILAGKNGVGKSTVFDGMAFALFDQLRSGNNADLVNHNSDLADIKFDFFVGAGAYRIHRTIQKNGSTTRKVIPLSQTGGVPSARMVAGTDKMDGFKQWVETEVGLNPDVFNTSIMLRQGQADALLQFDRKQRYNVLSRLIDLSKYEALAERAKEKKNLWGDRAEQLARDLIRIGEVTDQDLAEARQSIKRAILSAEQAQNRVGELTALFGQAKEWELQDGDLQTSRKRREGYQHLIEQEVDINRGYARLVDLRAVLPGLMVVRDVRVGIAAAEESIRALEQEEESCIEPLRQAEDRTRDRTQEVSRQEALSERLDESRRHLANRMRELEPTIRLLEKIAEVEPLVRGYQAQLADYPQNLDDLVRAAQEECERLKEAQDAGKPLARLLTEKLALQNAARKSQELSQKIILLERGLPGLQAGKQAAQEAAERAQQAVTDARDALTQAQTRLSEVKDRQQRFQDVAGEAKCRYCGQDMTEDHKEKERAALSNEVAEWEKAVAEARKRHGEAAAVHKQAAEHFSSTTTALTNLDNQIRDARRDLGSAGDDLQGKGHAIATTYHSLPPHFQRLVASQEPASLTGWLDTTYPSQADIRALDDEAKRLEGKQNDLNQLVKQQTSRSTATALLEAKQKELDAARAGLQIGYEQTREEYDRLSAEKNDTETAYRESQNNLRQARQDLENARGEAQRLVKKQVDRQAKLGAQQESLLKDRATLQLQIAQIPDPWKTNAGGITPDRLEELKFELQGLGDYERLHQGLLGSRQNIADLDERIQKAEAIIENLSVEARCPASQVEQELNAARRVATDADREQQAAEQSLASRQAQRQQYAEQDLLRREAARKSYLYGVLAEKFGERGIQLILVRNAEDGIVRLANEMLHNLTGGRSQLRLRERGGNHAALDLEVFDGRTGGGVALPVGMASGSQKFRIAISLALAIGQYLGHESRHIESVVIDEGFGSLDTEGRESMIQELHNLRQHLKRIILVSHQEEFSRGFATGYTIKLENGASEVYPLEN